MHEIRTKGYVLHREENTAVKNVFQENKKIEFFQTNWHQSNTYVWSMYYV